MKPVPAPAMPPFRLPLVAAALLLSSVLFPGGAGAEWGLEITPYAGYTIGGSFTDNATGANLDVQEDGSYGLVLDLADTPETQYELFYGLQRTKVTGGGTFGGKPSLTWTSTTFTWGGPTCLPGIRSAPTSPGGSAPPTLCRMEAGWIEKRTFPSRWAAASRYRSPVTSVFASRGGGS